MKLLIKPKLETFESKRAAPPKVCRSDLNARFILPGIDLSHLTRAVWGREPWAWLVFDELLEGCVCQFYVAKTLQRES
jgi:hypothetical protein